MQQDTATPSFSRGFRLAGAAVHLYTAAGTVVGLLIVLAAIEGETVTALWLFFVALFIDGTDGTLARRFRVKESIPWFDGALLDNIVDFLTFVFVPALALPALGMLQGGWVWLALFPLMASGYQFCQSNAKTDQSFVGFPSYWNILVLYFYVMRAEPLTIAAQLVFFSFLVFVPIHYLYPTKTRFLRRFTLPISIAWSFSLLPLCIWPDAPWAPTFATISLLGPAYYFVASLVHHRRLQSAPAA